MQGAWHSMRSAAQRTQHGDQQRAGALLSQLPPQARQLVCHALPRPLQRMHAQGRLRRGELGCAALTK